MSDYAIVVIGRNEAVRLPDCFRSVGESDVQVVYVDSGSTDSSVDIAKATGALVHELDPATPFSAARARNEGFERLLTQRPDLHAVQFIDGDCQFIDGWMEQAIAALRDDETIAAVVGHLTEMHPDKSVYNRLCSLEWSSAAGDMTDFGAFGGISMIRTSVFKELGGFNPDIIAGEDSDFALRMSRAGYRVTKLDTNMAVHDAEITHFSQWWKRVVRAGHAIGQRAHMSKLSGGSDMKKEIRSTWLWGLVLPVIILAGLLPSKGLSALLLGGYPLLYYKIFSYRRRVGDTTDNARLYAKYTLIGKFANMLGLIKFYLNRLMNRYHIIEYK